MRKQKQKYNYIDVMGTCWIIVENGLTGTENQCLGVAEALGMDFEVKRITLRQPWKFLTPYLGFEQSWSFTPAFKGPWPDIVIAGGRKALAAARYIKKQSGGKTFTVILQNPRVKSKYFDLIAAPAHDDVRGENVISTIGAPNRITHDKLAAAKIKFGAFESIPSPRVAVLIGGNSKTHKLTKPLMKKLIADLKNLNCGLMMTASRRTGAENLQMLKHAHIGFLWDGTGENPYHGMLAWADYILVTNDSVSMISDAATTGKPVYIIPLEGSSRRFDRFYDLLRQKNITRIFDGALDSWPYEALKESQHVARAIVNSVKKDQ